MNILDLFQKYCEADRRLASMRDEMKEKQAPHKAECDRIAQEYKGSLGMLEVNAASALAELRNAARQSLPLGRNQMEGGGYVEVRKPKSIVVVTNLLKLIAHPELLIQLLDPQRIEGALDVARITSMAGQDGTAIDGVAVRTTSSDVVISLPKNKKEE